MSLKNNFKISINQLIGHSILILVGTLLASFFIHLSPQGLQNEFFEKFTDYFIFSGPYSCLLLIIKECCWILLIASFSYIPYGRIFSLLILIYKGFSIGVVSSIACRQLGFMGFKYTFFLIFPPNLLYIISLCIAAQISFEIYAGISNKIGRHEKIIQTNKSAYLICFILTVTGSFMESYLVPWLYEILF